MTAEIQSKGMCDLLLIKTEDAEYLYELEHVRIHSKGEYFQIYISRCCASPVIGVGITFGTRIYWRCSVSFYCFDWSLRLTAEVTVHDCVILAIGTDIVML